MKLSNALSPVIDLYYAIRIAFPPTLKAVCREPSLLTKWHVLSRVFMAHVWVVFGEGTDASAMQVKTTLLCEKGYEPEGVVMDLGAAHGHTVKYLDRAKVTHFVALEPNVLMHPRIRALAQEVGFHESDGSLIILSCLAEDTNGILTALAEANVPISPGASQPVDTIVSILTLCTIPSPERTLSNLIRDVLKPGGTFLSYEHILSHREDVAWWQRLWAPLWAVFLDGCRMDRASDLMVKGLEVDDGEGGGKRASVWREWKVWDKEGDWEENLFIHSVGRFVKR